MSTNDFFNETPILLPTRAASSGVAINKTEYAVVDGMTPYIYLFSFCGGYKGAVPVLRPYKRITYSMETDSYYALSNGCYGNVYTLNCRFEETDKILIDCSSALWDISLLSGGECSEEFILTSPHSVSSYTKSGGQINQIRHSEKNVFFTSFVKTSTVSAEGISKGCEEYIRLIVGCEENRILIPRCISLKNLFTTDGGGIYGFFSKNYVNNFIVPLYENESVNPSFFQKINKI
jgi:hypothetical protein